MTRRLLSLVCLLVIAGLGWRASAIPGGMPADCCCVTADVCHVDGGHEQALCSCAPAPLPEPDRTAIPHRAVTDYLTLLSLRLPLTDAPAHVMRRPATEPADHRPALAATARILAMDDAPLFVLYCSYLT